MPSGKKDVYGTSSKTLYKSGTVKGERMAEMLRERIKSPMPKEGTTRPPQMMKPAKAPQVIRTTVSMKSSPTTTKRK